MAENRSIMEETGAGEDIVDSTNAINQNIEPSYNQQNHKPVTAVISSQLVLSIL